MELRRRTIVARRCRMVDSWARQTMEHPFHLSSSLEVQHQEDLLNTLVMDLEAACLHMGAEAQEDGRLAPRSLELRRRSTRLQHPLERPHRAFIRHRPHLELLQALHDLVPLALRS